MVDSVSVSPVEFTLDYVKLFNYSGRELNISAIGATINIYEDMLSNSLSGEIVINDANSLVSNFPIIGQERIDIAYHTKSKSGKLADIRLSFEVYSITRGGKQDEKRNEIYTLHFCSPEANLNARKRISKALSGDPANLIGDVLLENFGLQSDKRYDYMPTKFIENVVVPYWTPFQTINYLQKKAVSPDYKGASFMFYETTKGFRFECLESIYKTKEVQTFIYRPNNIMNKEARRDYDRDATQIEKFSRDAHFNSMKNMSSGMYGSRLATHDIVTKKITFTDFNLIDQYNDCLHIEGLDGNSGQKLKIPASIKPDKYGKRLSDYSTAKIDFYPKHEGLYGDGTEEETKAAPEDWLSQRASQFRQLDSLSITIGIAGDSELRVGQIVKVLIPSDENLASADDQWDKILSGRYLITSITHSLSRNGYDMIVRLNKDSLRIPLP